MINNEYKWERIHCNIQTKQPPMNTYCTVGQNDQEYRLEYLATYASVRLFARTACSLTSLTPSLVGKETIRWLFCLCLFLFSTIVKGCVISGFHCSCWKLSNFGTREFLGTREPTDRRHRLVPSNFRLLFSAKGNYVSFVLFSPGW